MKMAAAWEVEMMNITMSTDTSSSATSQTTATPRQHQQRHKPHQHHDNNRQTHLAAAPSSHAPLLECCASTLLSNLR
jgi:hypothetical protein